MHERKGKRRTIAALAAAMLAWLVGAQIAQASFYEYNTNETSVSLGARYRQDFMLGFSRTMKGSKFQPTGLEYLLEQTTNASFWRNKVRAKLTLNLWGDGIYNLRQNSGSFGSTNIDPRTGANDVFQPYGDASNRVSSLRDRCKSGNDCSNFIRDTLIREASVVFSDREAGYNITLGKFQRGWGQADGLRLMDVINPLDFRKRFLLRDFDELRIEQWMADFIFFTDPYVNLGQYGIHNPNIEFIWIPNVRHDEFDINNAYEEGGGLWAFNLPSRAVSPQGKIPDGVYFHVIRQGAQDTWFEPTEGAYAGRLAWNMFDTDITMSAYYGWQELFITRLHGNQNGTPVSGVQLGGDETPNGQFGSHTGANVYVGTTGHGPILIQASPAATNYAFRLATDGNPATLRLGQNCNLSVLGIALPGGAPGGCSAVANVLADFRERRKLVGVTAIRDLGFIKLPPRDVSPVGRLEISYEFDKPFNTFNAVNEDSIAVKKHDFLSVLAGYDYFLWLPTPFYDLDWVRKYVFYQPRGFFTSFQVFYFKVFGACGKDDFDGATSPFGPAVQSIGIPGQGVNLKGGCRVLWQSPYLAWRRTDPELWFTFLWFNDVYKDLIHLEGLNVYELQHSSYILRQRADFKFFGDHFFPRVEIAYFDGRRDQVGGVFDTEDYVNVGFTYQF